jgi:hypothetical protein
MDQSLAPDEPAALSAGKTVCKQTGAKARSTRASAPKPSKCFRPAIKVQGGDTFPTRQAARTNDLFAAFDLQTARGRRIADIARKLLIALGNPTDTLVQAQIIQAAELTVLCEDARTEALNAEPGKAKKAALDQVIRLQPQVDRAYARLGMFDARKNRSHHKRQNHLGTYLGEAAE